MADAVRDDNSVPALIAALNTDGATATRVYAKIATNCLVVNDDTTGSDLTRDIDLRDANGVPFMMAVSEVDGVTPVVLYVNSQGELLVDST